MARWTKPRGGNYQQENSGHFIIGKVYFIDLIIWRNNVLFVVVIKMNRNNKMNLLM